MSAYWGDKVKHETWSTSLFHPFLFPFLFSPFYLYTNKLLLLQCQKSGKFEVVHTMCLLPSIFQGTIWQLRILSEWWEILCPYYDCNILVYLYFFCNMEQKQTEELLLLYVSRSHSGTYTWCYAILPGQSGGSCCTSQSTGTHQTKPVIQTVKFSFITSCFGVRTDYFTHFMEQISPAHVHAK